jgi:hypothetical protein
MTQIHVDNIKKNFLKPPLSERAPRKGEIIATKTAVIPIPNDHKVSASSLELQILAKYIGYKKVIIIVVKG